MARAELVTRVGAPRVRLGGMGADPIPTLVLSPGRPPAPRRPSNQPSHGDADTAIVPVASGPLPALVAPPPQACVYCATQPRTRTVSETTKRLPTCRCHLARGSRNPDAEGWVATDAAPSRWRSHRFGRRKAIQRTDSVSSSMPMVEFCRCSLVATGCWTIEDFSPPVPRMSCCSPWSGSAIAAGVCRPNPSNHGRRGLGTMSEPAR
jgi:hypothetical protein